MYMHTHCSYTEEYSPEHVYVFRGKCIVTKKEVTVRVKAIELFQYNQGQLIQQALASNTVDEREFLMSGMSGEGFDFMVTGRTAEELDG